MFELEQQQGTASTTSLLSILRLLVCLLARTIEAARQLSKTKILSIVATRGTTIRIVLTAPLLRLLHPSQPQARQEVLKPQSFSHWHCEGSHLFAHSPTIELTSHHKFQPNHNLDTTITSRHLRITQTNMDYLHDGDKLPEGWRQERYPQPQQQSSVPSWMLQQK